MINTTDLTAEISVTVAETEDDIQISAHITGLKYRGRSESDYQHVDRNVLDSFFDDLAEVER